MTLSAEQRTEIANAFTDAMTLVDGFIHAYAEKVGAPPKFSLSVYDATGQGADWLSGGEVVDRSIGLHEIRTADWGERNTTDVVRRKVRASLRTGRDSGDLVRNAKELFQEGDAPNPGACLAEVNGMPICVAGGGLRGQEDEAFALLTIEMLKRKLNPAP